MSRKWLTKPPSKNWIIIQTCFAQKKDKKKTLKTSKDSSPSIWGKKNTTNEHMKLNQDLAAAWAVLLSEDN